MITLSHYDIIRKPVITEKSTAVSEHNKVIFQVAPSATKGEIKAAVEALFKVKVKSVNTLIRKGKNKRFRGIAGRTGDTKRAIVTLVEGQMIDVTTGL
ncbi:MAG TPA: 50S ribosomal protein L23 [Bauldia sp.]|nr:50S ribosomal protein L23 [Bauldia sp.]